MIFLLIAILIFAADLSCKKYVEANVSELEEKQCFGGKLRIKKVHNPGLCMGMIGKRSKVVFRISSLVTGCAIVKFFIRLFCGDGRVKTLGSAMMAGGALSNWFDRFHQGHVTDYLHWHMKPGKKKSKWNAIRKRINEKQIYFNLADLFLVIGYLADLLGSSRKRN